MNNIIKHTGIKFGIINSVILILAYLLFYQVNYKWMNNIFIGFSLYGILILFGLVASYITKQKLGGLITFREAFTSYFLAIAIPLFVSTMFLYVLYGWLDTETAELLKQDVIRLTEEQMKNFGVPQEQAKISVDSVASSSPYSLGTLLNPTATRIIMLSIPGFLIALAMRNKSDFSSIQQ